MSSQKLSQNIKDKLIQKTLQHKLKKAENSGNGIASLLKSTTSKQAKANRFDQHQKRCCKPRHRKPFFSYARRSGWRNISD